MWRRTHCVRSSGSSALSKKLHPPLLYRTTWGVPHFFGMEGFDQIGKVLREVTHDETNNTKLFQGIEFCAGTFFPFLGEEKALVEAMVAADLRCIVQVHTCGYPVPAAFSMGHVKMAGAHAASTIPAWRQHADSLRFHAEDMAVRLRVPEGALTERAMANPEFAVAAAAGGGGTSALTTSAGGDASRSLLIAAFNVHSAKDSLPRDDALRFLEEACRIERDIGIPICHETHRQRLFHSPFVLQSLRDDLPATLKLTCDLSHFVVALERVMCHEMDAEFWPELLKEVLARRAYMMHCRVGLPQSPQLQNPRPHHAKYAVDYEIPAAEYAPSAAASAAVNDVDADEFDAVDSHVMWWRTIAGGMRERGVPVRVVPEYGPAPYQTTGDAAFLDAVVRDAGRFLRAAL